MSAATSMAILSALSDANRVLSVLVDGDRIGNGLDWQEAVRCRDIVRTAIASAAQSNGHGHDVHVEAPAAGFSSEEKPDLHRACRVGAGARDAMRQFALLRRDLEHLAEGELTAARAAYQKARRELAEYDIESERMFAELQAERQRVEAQAYVAKLQAAPGSAEVSPNPVQGMTLDEALKDLDSRVRATVEERIAGRHTPKALLRTFAATYLRAGERYLALMDRTEAELRRLIDAGDAAATVLTGEASAKKVEVTP